MRKTIRNFDARPVEDVLVAQPSESGKGLPYENGVRTGSRFHSEMLPARWSRHVRHLPAVSGA